MQWLEKPNFSIVYFKMDCGMWMDNLNGKVWKYDFRTWFSTWNINVISRGEIQKTNRDMDYMCLGILIVKF